MLEPLCATILVVVVTQHRLILAADSRKTYLYPGGALEQGTIDKIYKTNDCYYAISGFHSSTDGRLHIPVLIHHLLLRHSNLHEAVRHLATAIATELKRYFTDLKNTHYTLFKPLLAYNSSGGEMVLVKRVDGVPTACLLDYKIIDWKVVKVVVNTWQTDRTKIERSDSCFWRAIGNTDFLHLHMPAEKEMAADPVQKAKDIIYEGAKIYPKLVGGPINILQLTTDGEEWILRSATCPNRITEK